MKIQLTSLILVLLSSSSLGLPYGTEHLSQQRLPSPQEGHHGSNDNVETLSQSQQNTQNYGALWDPEGSGSLEQDGDIGIGVDPLEPSDRDLSFGVEPHNEDDDTKHVDETVPKNQDKGSSFYNYFKSWADKLAGKDEQSGARGVLNSIKSVFRDFKEKIPVLFEKFKSYLSDLSIYVQRGADYVVQCIARKFKDVDGSTVLSKLEKRLEEGDESIRVFFDTIGRKVTAWLKDRGQDANIDKGLLTEQSQISEHFQEPDFDQIMQDREIHGQLEKMVERGVLTQKEMDTLYKPTINQENVWIL